MVKVPFVREALRSPVVTLLLCLILAGALAGAGMVAGMRTVLPGPSSARAIEDNPAEQWASAAGVPPQDMALLFLGSSDFKVDDPSFIGARDSLLAMLRAMRGVESGAPLFSGVQTAGTGWLDDDKFISADRHMLLVKADTVATVDKAPKELAGFPEAIRRWKAEHPGFEAGYLSNGLADSEIFELIDRDLDHSLRYTLPLTLIVLLWTFRSLIAAAIPLVVALISLAASLGASALLSHLMDPVSAAAAQLVVLLVLAIGIDYSLFIISRVREEVGRGLSYPDAVRRARAGAGVAVFWSGLTVAISLAGLLLMRDSILTSMALVTIAAVAITMIFTLVALPAFLLLLGHRLEWGRLPTFGRTGIGSSWLTERWVRLGVRRPLTSIFIAVSIIASVAYWFLHIRLGSTIEPSKMPPSMQSFQAFAIASEKFPEIAGTDFTVILASPSLDALDDEGKLEPFFDSVLENPAVKGPIRVEWSPDRTVARYRYVAEGSVNDPANRDVVRRIREVAAPEHLESLGVRAGMSGTLPFVVDDVVRYSTRAPLVFLLVLLVSTVFLLVAFRSIVVPLKAILLNLMSTAAAFGSLVFVFQYSQLSGWSYGVVESFVPPLLFCILFGLSMDYHVFLLSRIREEAERREDTADAVEAGVLSTARTITGAALIMVCVFTIIACLELPVMRQLGFGLAVAVLLDATIIRLLLLPASMVLLGRWNWYLPRSLRWLPVFRLD